MSTATVAVSGAQAAKWAAELRGVLAASAGAGERVSRVEVEKSATVVVAVIGLVFSGVGTAKTLWDWWQGRRKDEGGVTVTVQFGDGTSIALANTNLEQLQIVFQQADSQQH
ncbi:hypothetical protein [Micromonospora sp. RP3T]|uniref:hypothetical protein n=1 Tax=Micromonospora sp. RP3T TaxID=2135446 RepID=UPI003D7275B3